MVDSGTYLASISASKVSMMLTELSLLTTPIITLNVLMDGIVSVFTMLVIWNEY